MTSHFFSSGGGGAAAAEPSPAPPTRAMTEPRSLAAAIEQAEDDAIPPALGVDVRHVLRNGATAEACLDRLEAFRAGGGGETGGAGGTGRGRRSAASPGVGVASFEAFAFSGRRA